MSQTYAQTPKRAIEDGDEAFGWDSSAGEEAFFSLGAAASKKVGGKLDELPSGQALQDGLTNSETPNFGSGGLFFPGPVKGVTDRYLLLGAVANGIGAAAEFRLNAVFFAALGNSSAAANAMGFVTAHRDQNGLIAGHLQYFSTDSASTTLPAKVVTLDFDGESWVALDSGKDGSATAFRRLLFLGVRRNLQMQWIAAADASAIADIAYSGYHEGTPGAAIGQNQSLHISGSPGTSKEVMVDGNGFIVEV